MAMAPHHHITPLIVSITTCFILAYTASSTDIFVPIGGGGTNNAVIGTRMIDDCWTAFFDVRSCSDEFASYFKGSEYVGFFCCRVIKAVTIDCWPNLMHVIGITFEEVNVLRGYCDVPPDSSSTPVIDPVL